MRAALVLIISLVSVRGTVAKLLHGLNPRCGVVERSKDGATESHVGLLNGGKGR